jgi:hypothetical protein
MLARQDPIRAAADGGAEARGSTWASGIGICRPLAGGHMPPVTAIPHLLGGSSFLPLRRSLLRATGSKFLTSSSDGGGTTSDDADSTSFTASVEALRRHNGRVAHIAGLASLRSAEAVRNGSSRRAIVR